MHRLSAALAIARDAPRFHVYGCYRGDVLVYIGSSTRPETRAQRWTDCTMAILGSYQTKRTMLDAEREHIERLLPVGNARYVTQSACYPLNKAR